MGTGPAGLQRRDAPAARFLSHRYPAGQRQLAPWKRPGAPGLPGHRHFPHADDETDAFALSQRARLRVLSKEKAVYNPPQGLADARLACRLNY